MEDKIRVLVVDDAGVMRRAVSDILNSDPMIEVVGDAKNGLLGLEKAKELKPDVITLDMDMPVMNGISTTRHVMIKCQIPIVVLSSLFTDGAVTFEALRLGVVDFVPKPSGAVSRDLNEGRERIIERVKMAASVNVDNIRRAKLPIFAADEAGAAGGGAAPEALVLMGTNLCGPNTVIRTMAHMMRMPQTSIIVIQSISNKILPSFVEEFDKFVSWRIKALQEDTIIEPGVCYIGSNENSLVLDHIGDEKYAVMVGEAVDKPIDMLYNSAAESFDGFIAGVLLGGIGDDGAMGLANIREYGGVTMAHDNHYCVFPNLTENAIQQQVVDRVVNDHAIPGAILETVRGHLHMA
ncbi:MAG: hypothetical protein CSB24_04860 [Deltaproteobacteria bacterium]|nr:MAG: hypothetical protein CSB24_04860 [Deltaproteobacteria bacterium]